MRKFLVASVIIGLCGCASDAQKDEAMRATIRCMKSMAQQLDDGKSDAETIGYAIRGACSAEIQRSIDTFEAGLTNIYSDQLLEAKIRQQELETATEVVLMERRGQ